MDFTREGARTVIFETLPGVREAPADEATFAGDLKAGEPDMQFLLSEFELQFGVRFGGGYSPETVGNLITDAEKRYGTRR
ncbi:MAG: hypothetical protein KJ718_03785 [Nanoarchaeota archaeon]|nr:hypothetical protein [Nanoarchaeota archaeon]MBU1051652.1 hypothetical protein [Nanoarchaeota archaeon]MBU1987943.1 hypothetical protein [Nanoarchaeota archaeon]